MKAIGIILAGGNNSRMQELSNKRAIAAMPIGGSYRSIDFALSNMSNSHVQTVAVLTQYSARSLNEHLSSSKWWDFGRKQGGLFVFNPTVTVDNSWWYRGTADAMYQNINFLKKRHEPYVIITSGDCIYKLDYNKVLDYHIEKKADITVVCKDMAPGEDVSRYGVVRMNEDSKIVEFEEKPMVSKSNTVSTGIYIVRRRQLIEMLERSAAEERWDFDTMSIMNRTLMLQPVQPWEQDHCLKQVYFSMGLSTEEKDEFERRFHVQLLNSYGMTETISAVTCSPISGDKNWPSVGRAALSYDIKIIDCDGKEVAPGKTGEICVHGIPGRSLTPGYYNDPGATECLLDKDGWLHSGDRGYIDEAGWLFFIDRWGNMIKRSGENISSLEVECVLTSHPKIADAAVIGIPDPIRNQAVKAFIQFADGESLTIAELEQYCSDRLSKFKVPTFWQFVDDFPRTATGKIKKKELK